MNEHTQTVVAELRDRYAPTAVPPCRICGGGLSLERCGAGSPSVWRCAGRVEGGYAPGRKIADQHYKDSEWTDYKAGGDQRVIDICDALESSERRAEEAEARDAHNRAEVERVIGPTLAAMKRAGIDSLPDATEELIRRLDAAEARVAEVEATQKMRAESADPNDETWHTREEYLRRVKADARVADLESVREEQAAKLRRHLDELRAATLHIEDLEAKNARLEARLVAMCSCVDYRIHCKGGDTQYCQSGHDHETVGPRKGCKKCGGSGAVILEGGE